MTNREIVIGRILDREGGIADVHDGMGTTYFGQTLGWLYTYHLEAPQTREAAATNYASWMEQTKLGQVCDKDVDLGDDVCDFEINAGAPNGVKALQAALHVQPQSGWIGPLTLAALAACQPRAVRCEVLAQDISRRGKLIAYYPDRFAKFAAGWANRDAGKIRLLA